MEDLDEIDLKEIFEMFWKKKFLIIVIMVIFAILGTVYTNYFITPLYSSYTTMVLVQSDGTQKANQSQTYSSDETGAITSTDITLNSNLIENYAQIAQSKTVIGQVISNLNLDITMEEFLGNLSVTTITDTEILNVKYTDPNPEQASNITNELAKIFIEKTDELYKANNIYVLDKATPDYDPVNVSLIKNVVIFVFIGLVIVSAYILILNMLDTTIKTDSDITKVTGVLVLASIFEYDYKNNGDISDDENSDLDND